MRSVLRALGAMIAVLLAALVPLLAGAPGVQASSVAVQPRALTIAITAMTPSTALPNSMVTVSGTLANHTGSAVSGLTVQATTSTGWFQYPEQMTLFANGAATGTIALPLQLQQAGTPYQVTATVPNGATVPWSVSFPAGIFYDQFGVFPIQVRAGGLGTAYTATARTFLPFWPGGSTATQPKGLQVAWVWPLIDTPQQGACPQTLRTSELASSVASGGRLSTLLDAGAAAAQADHLTWDIDPALLSDVSVMTHSYFTHGNDVCSERVLEKPNTAATQWLSQLKTSTAGEPAFLSPYANVDVAALSHSGLDLNIQAAYRLGETVAGQILPNTFGTTGTGTGDGAVLKAAWPADGLADAGVLTSLASEGGISTVVLGSDELPSTSFAEDALAKTVSGVGTSMSVLLANSRITSLLATASTARSQASQFAVTQDFLAQTAMIAAETGTSRSLVIAPPTGWDPTPAVANALLSITDHAQWLHPTGLASLAAAAAKLPSTTHVPAKQMSGAELSDAYLDEVSTVQSSLSVFKDLLYQPPAREVNQLDAAVAALESSAWRGSGSYGGSLATGQLAGYVANQENKVQMIASKKLLLAGQSGETPVSVRNGLGEAIQVQVMATTPPGSDLQVGGSDGMHEVQAHGSSTIKMSVHSSTIGTTTVQLQLVTQDGSPLSWTAQPLSVEVTRFGRLLLIIIGGALGILVLTSAYRLRRKRLAGARNGGSADQTAEGGGTG
ncbi:MAG TPA: DUF6049 family protein [Trebonia sp.]|nr:DUF6049 family protein [Trebonia sp.]